MEKEQAHLLLDRLAPAQFDAVAKLLEVLAPGGQSLRQSLEEAAVEDEGVTEEMAASLDRARASLRRGEGISHEEILLEFGLSK